MEAMGSRGGGGWTRCGAAADGGRLASHREEASRREEAGGGGSPGGGAGIGAGRRRGQRRGVWRWWVGAAAVVRSWASGGSVTAGYENLGWDRGDREEIFLGWDRRDQEEIRDRGKVEDRCGRGWAFFASLEFQERVIEPYIGLT